jgi:hypothetical protein
MQQLIASHSAVLLQYAGQRGWLGLNIFGKSRQLQLHKSNLISSLLIMRSSSEGSAPSMVVMKLDIKPDALGSRHKA